MFKQDKVIMSCKHTGATVVHLIGVKDEAFLPKKFTIRCVAPHVIELGAIVFKTSLQDILNVKKVTHCHLSCLGLTSSWLKRQETLGLEITNDYSESSLGETTNKINKFSRINQHNAAAVNVTVGELDTGRDLSAWRRSRRRVSSNSIRIIKTLNTLNLSVFAYVCSISSEIRYRIVY